MLTEIEKKQLLLNKLRQIIREEIEKEELNEISLTGIGRGIKRFLGLGGEEDVGKTQRIDMSRVKFEPVPEETEPPSRIRTRRDKGNQYAGGVIKDIKIDESPVKSTWGWLSNETSIGFPGSITVMKKSLDTIEDRIISLQKKLALKNNIENERELIEKLQIIYINLAKIKQIINILTRKRFDTLYRMIKEKPNETKLFLDILRNIVKLFIYIEDKKPDEQLKDLKGTGIINFVRTTTINDINDFFDVEQTRLRRADNQLQGVLNIANVRENKKIKNKKLIRT